VLSCFSAGEQSSIPIINSKPVPKVSVVIFPFLLMTYALCSNFASKKGKISAQNDSNF
jgi:hypothetical protein